VIAQIRQARGVVLQFHDERFFDRAEHAQEIGQIVRVRRAYVFGPVVYAVATIAALFQPVLSLVVNASLWLLWIGFGYHSTRQDVR